MIDKLSYVIFAAFVLVTITTAQYATICDEEEPHTFISDVRDCNGWFYCHPEGPQPGNCDREYHFNPVTRSCDWPENVECFECPRNERLSFHSMRDRCRSFVQCVDGFPTQHICEAGLQFNNVTGMCDLTSVVQCSMRLRCPDRLPDDGRIIAFRDQFNCSVFSQCIGDPDPIRRECNRELHFDPLSGLCTWPHLTDCEAPVLPPEDPVFRCERNGHHAHPSSCSIYFICVEGTPHRFECADGLHYNEDTEMCDKPERANCDRERQNEQQPIESLS